jgi:hypothetical protein
LNIHASGRPRSLAEMQERQQKSYKPDDVARSIASWKPEPTDVVISPYAKCGTTWLQQTFHCLRTQGDMDFDDISRVVPWIEMATACGLDLNASQRAAPRGYKSHLPLDLLPKGARYVVSFREPKDALVSHYHFMEGWWFEPGTISLEDHVNARLSRRGDGQDYWHHLLSFWEQRDNPDVLIFSYEHMSEEPAAHIEKLARFAGIMLDKALLDLTLEHSSIGFMLAHKDRFDDAMMRELSEIHGGLPPGSDSAKVRQGKIGSHKAEMSAELAAKLDAIWTETITTKTGFANYAELERAVRARF